MLEVFSQWFTGATLMDWLTNVSALVAVLLLLLVIIGFRRYIKRPRTVPIDYVATGIWTLCFVMLGRQVFWDVLPDLFPNFQRWSDIGVHSQDVNWIFNTGMIAACLFMLKGYHMLVEEKVPGRYTILTAVFYPKRLRLWITARGEPDE